MKYSIRGSIRTTDEAPIVAEINRYTLWRLVTDNINDGEYPAFTFEVWLNSEEDKSALFNSLKTHVDGHIGKIDWHRCTHDEPNKTPCDIVETYTVGV